MEWWSNYLRCEVARRKVLVERAVDSKCPFVHDVRINHSRSDVFMFKNFVASSTGVKENSVIAI